MYLPAVSTSQVGTRVTVYPCNYRHLSTELVTRQGHGPVLAGAGAPPPAQHQCQCGGHGAGPLQPGVHQGGRALHPGTGRGSHVASIDDFATEV